VKISIGNKLQTQQAMVAKTLGQNRIWDCQQLTRRAEAVVERANEREGGDESWKVSSITPCRAFWAMGRNLAGTLNERKLCRAEQNGIM
jgi:hypothetical protein